MSDPYEVQWGELRERLSSAAQADAVRYDALARRLTRPDDKLALDVGCGAAGMAIALANALSTQAKVLALDGNEELLGEARTRIEAAGHTADRVRAVHCDLHGGTAELRSVVDEPADVIWAAGVVHHVGDQQATVDQLADLLAPNGRLALGEGGLRPRYLPWDLGVGRPGLENRLEAAIETWFGRMREAVPESTRMPYGWGTALRRAGLVDVHTESTMVERPAPLSAEDTEFVVDGIAHTVERARHVELLDADDITAWERLLDPSDPAWLGARDDLYVLDVRSVHVGAKPESEGRT